MVQLSVFIATSLDGFIARPNGDLDWLPQPDGAEGSEDYGYQVFIDSVDAMLLGRKTYEKALTFTGGDPWPFPPLPLFVLSSRAEVILEQHRAKAQQLGGEPAAVVARLAALGHKHVYVDGGVTIQRFLRAGLIQQLIVTRVPVVLGAGIPLFGSTEADVILRHVQTKSYPTGLVQSWYEVIL